VLDLLVQLLLHLRQLLRREAVEVYYFLLVKSLEREPDMSRSIYLVDLVPTF
jgi:hypothetical protein